MNSHKELICGRTYTKLTGALAASCPPSSCAPMHHVTTYLRFSSTSGQVPSKHMTTQW